MARADGHKLRAELCPDRADGRRMYRLSCEDDRAVKIPDTILAENEVPDLNGWKDITAQVFPRDQRIEND